MKVEFIENRDSWRITPETEFEGRWIANKIIAGRDREFDKVASSVKMMSVDFVNDKPQTGVNTFHVSIHPYSSSNIFCWFDERRMKEMRFSFAYENGKWYVENFETKKLRVPTMLERALMLKLWGEACIEQWEKEIDEINT